jgi:hypothetical protein
MYWYSDGTNIYPVDSTWGLDMGSGNLTTTGLGTFGSINPTAQANEVDLGGNNLLNVGQLELPELKILDSGDLAFFAGVDETWLTSSAVGQIGIGEAGGIAAILDTTGLTTTDKTFTFPNLSGTIALMGVSQTTNFTTTGILSALSGTFSSLTSGRVPYASTAGLLIDDPDLTFDGTNLAIGAITPVSRLHTIGLAATDVYTNDAGINFRYVGLPPKVSLALVELDGNLGVGKYWWFQTYVTALGETSVNQAYPRVNITTDGTHKQVDVTVTASSDYRVTSINLYRSKLGGDYYIVYPLVAGLPNTNQVYRDNIADGALGAQRSTTLPDKTHRAISINGVQSLVIDPLLTVVGAGSGNLANYSGGNSVIIGGSNGTALTTGQSNMLIGTTVATTLTTGNQNIGIGNAALNVMQVDGAYNIAIGGNAGMYAGWSNIDIGYGAGANNVSSYNVCVGGGAGQGTASVSNYHYDTVIGYQAGYLLTTGGHNVLIGAKIGDALLTGEYNIVIGYDLDLPATSTSNSLIIGNLIYGTALAYSTATPSTGNVGIATVAPTARLHLPAGSATASTAPLKFTTGALLATPEAGTIEYLTNTFYIRGTDNLNVAGTGKFANLGTFSATPNANYGFYATLSGNGKYGVYNSASVLFGETQYGMYNIMYTQAGSTTAAEYVYGIKQALYSQGNLSSGYSYAYGMWNDLYISGNYTLDAGIYNNWSITGQNSYTYGFQDAVSSGGTSGGSHNAFYSSISDTSTGRANTGFYSSITPNAATNTATNFLGSITIYQTDTIAKVASFTISAGTITNPSNLQVATYVANNISGTDTGNKKWAFYNASTNTTAGKIFMGIDSVPTYWGTGFDSYILFDGNSLNIVANALTATDTLELTGATININNILKLTPTSAPGSPVEGMVYANSADHHLYFYNGTGWIQLDN